MKIIFLVIFDVFIKSTLSRPHFVNSFESNDIFSLRLCNLLVAMAAVMLRLRRTGDKLLVVLFPGDDR